MTTTGVPNTVRAQASLLTTFVVCGRLTRRTSEGVTSTRSPPAGSEARDFRSESRAYAATSKDGGMVGRLLLLTILFQYTPQNHSTLSPARTSPYPKEDVWARDGGRRLLLYFPPLRLPPT